MKNSSDRRLVNMTANNNDIANIFEEIADILTLQGANFYRIRAYRKAAAQLRDMSIDVAEYVENGQDLSQLPSIGTKLAQKIVEIIKQGRCSALETLREQSPFGLTELLHIPGLGPKRVNALVHVLGVHTQEQLLQAAKDGRVGSVAGLGQKIQANIIHTIESNLKRKTRLSRAIAKQYAEPILAYLNQIQGVEHAVIAGSYRRCKETVGDIDILVTTGNEDSVTHAFINYDQVRDVLSTGPTRSSVILYSGLQVDLRVVPNDCYGAALYYFTGSRSHNIALRLRAKARGLKINEYGVYKDKRHIAGETEESVLAAIDLPWIPPELRENSGEIDAAQRRQLPTLVTRDDIKGDLHSHTTASDGHHSLEEMAEAAKKAGLEYLAITEHSKRLSLVHGLDERRLIEQIDEINKLNSRFKGFTLLKGIEVDILENGDLDLSDTVLSKLDLVIGAVHSNFHLSRNKQTERIMRAMDRPHFTMLAHPSGRLLGSREAYDLDMKRIIQHAKQRGCFLELNAQPLRLDLNALHCRMAKSAGVLVSINSDAHQLTDFNNLQYGVDQARKGWMEKADILNTSSLSDLLKFLGHT